MVFSKNYFIIGIIVIILFVGGGLYFLERDKQISDGGILMGASPTEQFQGDTAQTIKGQDGIKITAIYNSEKNDNIASMLISFESSLDMRQFNFGGNVVMRDNDGKEYAPLEAYGNGFGDGKYFTLTAKFSAASSSQLVVKNLGEIKERIIEITR